MNATRWSRDVLPVLLAKGVAYWSMMACFSTAADFLVSWNWFKLAPAVRDNLSAQANGRVAHFDGSRRHGKGMQCPTDSRRPSWRGRRLPRSLVGAPRPLRDHLDE